MSGDLLPTTVVGSYPQPQWLMDREALGGRLPPRVRATELWRYFPSFLPLPTTGGRFMRHVPIAVAARSRGPQSGFAWKG